LHPVDSDLDSMSGATIQDGSSEPDLDEITSEDSSHSDTEDSMNDEDRMWFDEDGIRHHNALFSEHLMHEDEREGDSDEQTPTPAEVAERQGEFAQGGDSTEMLEFRQFVAEAMQGHLTSPEDTCKYSEEDSRRPLARWARDLSTEESDIVQALNVLTETWPGDSNDPLEDEPPPRLDAFDPFWGPARRGAELNMDTATVAPDDNSVRSTFKSICSDDSWEECADSEEIGHVNENGTPGLTAALLKRLPSPYGLGYDGDYQAPERDDDDGYFYPVRPHRLQMQVVEYGATQMLRRLQAHPD